VTGARTGGERRQVLLLAVLLIGGVAGYLGLTALNRDPAKQDLLPYQFLARSLPESEQQIFGAIREAILPMETARFETRRWLDPEALSERGVRLFNPSAADRGTARAWQKFEQGTTVNYLSLPADPAGTAWLLTITEPEPGSVPDTAPNDDEHHRLPDGTVLHIYVWTHRFGSEIKPAFIRQPETHGWIQIFRQPPNPVAAPGSTS
jgi:hypothetical protein